ncbi:PEP-CTERM sorting domain-containing protein [Roseiconus lacunae]|uniref:PEP-CTERM sorting domain-containing protein n=1 Tax=Roseiconus lacunae TaxID=2605694 RepID=UPI001E316F03|nr:PEP-CTERM sorting domain-containing protein [Roseiconus lacunae]
MLRPPMSLRQILLSVFCLTVIAGIDPSKADADVTNFLTWQPIADPVDPGFSVAASPTTANLFALDQPIAAGIDIGFASVNGSTVASSMTGHYFRPTDSFALAIDYDWSFAGNPSGLLGLGFGIGEDAAGENSAGIGLVANSGIPLLTYAGAARVNDVNQNAMLLGTPSELSGTLFVSFHAPNGDITVGAATTKGATMADDSTTFSSLQQQWNGDNLMVSFFMRSDQQSILQSWQGGQSEAAFSNFRVLSGAAVAIPEPSALILLSSLTGGFLLRRRRMT